MFARVILILLGLLAQAIGLPADQSDPTQWGSLALATGVVWGSVEYLRAYVFKSLQGVGVHLLAGGVGITLGFSLGFAEVLPGTWADWTLFGVQAVFYATLADVAGKTIVKNLTKARAA